MGNNDGEIMEPGQVTQSKSLGSYFSVMFIGPSKKTGDSTNKSTGKEEEKVRITSGRRSND